MVTEIISMIASEGTSGLSECNWTILKTEYLHYHTLATFFGTHTIALPWSRLLVEAVCTVASRTPRSVERVLVFTLPEEWKEFPVGSS